MDNLIDPNKLIDESKSSKKTNWENLFIKGDTYKNFATLIVIATRGNQKLEWNVECECPSCKNKFNTKIEKEIFVGFHPWVVESWKRFIKPMNVPIIEMVISGHEVGEAYNKAIDTWLTHPDLKSFKYILFVEDDIIVPFMPNSFGPLIELYKHLETYDVASGLYWTKGEPSLPLIYGDGNMNNIMPFAVNTDWKEGDVVNVNGSGMGFTLMKRDIFEDTRLTKPLFKTVSENINGRTEGFTQDLYFYKKIKELGYKICVDTGIKCGHLDIKSEIVY